ncbi:MAG: hypothetical protein H6667_18640 [Ardenticatenaceae bacterium]|nr:hypothetical protein [Ardenticatenaceae bacterium]MCB9446473.1 hypothetical protein [Ardenticatenaceae bacterium]
MAVSPTPHNIILGVFLYLLENDGYSNLEVIMPLESVASIMTIVIAVASLIFSISVEKRSNKRLELQIEREEKIARANIQPFISILHSKYDNSQTIALRNHGIGTAIITDISMAKNGQKAKKRIIELYKLPKNVVWRKFRTFRGGRIFLSAGGEIILAKITSEVLTKDKIFSQEEASEIIRSFQRQSEGITIEVTYEDMLGNRQKVHKRVLHD